MKKITIYFFFVFFAMNTFAQMNFTKGYIINDQGKKIECFIKNSGWIDNPSEISYKLSETSEILKGEPKSIKEFACDNLFKYESANVDIDRSSSDFGNLTNYKHPNWSNELLFLKTMIQGKAVLLFYKDGRQERYFYSVSGSPIKQLVFKEYLVEDGKCATNNNFKQQLLVEVSCPSIKKNEIEKLSYSKKSLVNYFNKYNSHFGNTSETFTPKKKTDFIFIKAKAGMNFSSLKFLDASASHNTIDFGTNNFPHIGIEAEILLPFNSNKMAITLEPNYRSLESEITYNSNKISINYSFLEIPIGLRYYFFLPNESRIFITAAANIKLKTSSDQELNIQATGIKPFEISPRPNYSYGAGYAIKRISCEFRYFTNDVILGNSYRWTEEHPRFSVIIGYKLLSLGASKKN